MNIKLALTIRAIAVAIFLSVMIAAFGQSPEPIVDHYVRSLEKALRDVATATGDRLSSSFTNAEALLSQDFATIKLEKHPSLKFRIFFTKRAPDNYAWRIMPYIEKTVSGTNVTTIPTLDFRCVFRGTNYIYALTRPATGPEVGELPSGTVASNAGETRTLTATNLFPTLAWMMNLQLGLKP